MMGPEATGSEVASRGSAPDTADYLARVARVAPDIREASETIERDRRFPTELLDALHREKLFRLLLPKAYDGEEIGPPAFFQTISAIAEHDASVAWCISQANGCSMTAAYVEPHVAQTVWGSDPRAVVAWGPGKADVTATDDGYRVTGRWQFASGSRHATWLGGRTPVPLPNGESVFRVLLFPASEAEMTDIWNVLGLRGTASDAYTVTDLFVPKDFMATRGVEAEERRYDAPLYLIPAHILFATGFAGVALGIARSMLEQFKELATRKKPSRTTLRLCESPVIQSEVAVAEARLGSAYAYVLKETSEVWDEVVATNAFTLAARMRIRLAATYAIHEAKDVVDAAYDAAGATTIFKGNPLERHFRDIHTLTQQSQGRKTHLQAAGAFMLGLDPDLPLPG